MITFKCMRSIAKLKLICQSRCSFHLWFHENGALLSISMTVGFSSSYTQEDPWSPYVLESQPTKALTTLLLVAAPYRLDIWRGDCSATIRSWVLISRHCLRLWGCREKQSIVHGPHKWHLHLGFEGEESSSLTGPGLNNHEGELGLWNHPQSSCCLLVATWLTWWCFSCPSTKYLRPPCVSGILVTVPVQNPLPSVHPFLLTSIVQNMVIVFILQNGFWVFSPNTHSSPNSQLSSFSSQLMSWSKSYHLNSKT